MVSCEIILHFFVPALRSLHSVVIFCATWSNYLENILQLIGDDMTDLDSEPKKPALTIVHVNMIGTMYTFKLAAHYFRKQPDTQERDRCLLITGSMTQYVDSPVSQHTPGLRRANFPLPIKTNTSRRNN
jgi:hypothetical protein